VLNVLTKVTNTTNFEGHDPIDVHRLKLLRGTHRPPHPCTLVHHRCTSFSEYWTAYSVPVVLITVAKYAVYKQTVMIVSRSVKLMH